MIIIILLGFRYSASSTPIISSVGVAIGAGSTPSISIFAICRNPIIPDPAIKVPLFLYLSCSINIFRSFAGFTAINLSFYLFFIII